MYNQTNSQLTPPLPPEYRSPSGHRVPVSMKYGQVDAFVHEWRVHLQDSLFQRLGHLGRKRRGGQHGDLRSEAVLKEVLGSVIPYWKGLKLYITQYIGIRRYAIPYCSLVT